MEEKDRLDNFEKLVSKKPSKFVEKYNNLKKQKMIKESELRIGNIVFYNGKHEEIGNVSGITSDFITEPKVYIDNRLDIPYQLSSLKPIPLTEEWLLKFGFIKTDSYVFINYGNVTLQLNKNTFFIELELKYENIELAHIKHVHQLQNLYFSLTGEELILKN